MTVCSLCASSYNFSDAPIPGCEKCGGTGFIADSDDLSRCPACNGWEYDGRVCDECGFKNTT